MARKKDTPQKAALREMMGNYLKENNVKVKDGTDVNSIMRDMMSIILDQEMDEELGYSKYDYRNKETDNSRNGHSQKTMHTSYGDLEMWVNEKALVAFKKRIPDIEVLETYLRKWKMSLCMENAVELKITLHNDGKAMAEEIYVDMDEPENVWVIDADEWESLSKFRTIADPLHAARQKRAIHKVRALEIQNNFGHVSRASLVSGLAYPSELINFPLSPLTPSNKDFYCRVEDGDVVLHLDKLLHGRMFEFKKIYMIPKKAGEADMKVAYQCRQFPDAIMGKVKIEVLAEK